ncbi:MAG: hypothetical protein V4532_15685, partial [Pseudomonadota bacterium]
MIKPLPAALLMALCTCAAASELHVPIPQRPDLVLDVPTGWRHQVSRLSPDTPPTISLASPDGRAFVLTITPSWPESPAAAGVSAKDLHQQVQHAANAEKPHAVESTLPLIDLDSSGKYGFYFSATEKTPDPDGHKYRTQGAIALNELSVGFTVLSQSDPAVVTEQ